MKTVWFRDEALGEAYVEATHESGLKVMICPKPAYHSAYALFGAKYGSIDTNFGVNGGKVTRTPAGIAHFLEHKLFESEQGDAFVRFSKTGAYANAYTSFDRTCYLFSCTDCFSDNLAILLDFVQSPYFTKETVEKEQGIIGQEIRMYEDSAPWRAMFGLLRQLYHRHPVKIDICGSVESIRQIDRELLYRCYNTFYDPSNMFLCIAGNVETERVLEQIENSLRAGASPSIERETYEEPDAVVEPYAQQRLEIASPIFCLGFKESAQTPKGSLRSRLATDVMLELLCGNTTALYKQWIDDGLINDAFSSEYLVAGQTGTILFEGESKDPKALQQALLEAARKMRERGVDEVLFEEVRKRLYGDIVMMYNKTEPVVSALTDCAVYGQNLFDARAALEALTPQDAWERLTFLEPQRAALSVVLPR